MSQLDSLKGNALVDQIIPLLGVPREQVILELNKYLKSKKLIMSELTVEDLRGFASEMLLDMAIDHRPPPNSKQQLL